ncbi:MAG: YkgJ family cysteine cluster protein [Deltaproteobacteria bacterium]|nr:YkgJ family cysteine cluster protein [Deltaproteobacteria bacterium]
MIVGLLDGTRDAEALLHDAQIALGEELNPLGLVELLQALDRRALLDTPRARMVVAQGLVRADIAALQRLARRVRPLRTKLSPEARADMRPPRLAPESRFSCASCNRCCSETHLLGPVTRAERDVILEGFNALPDPAGGADPSNFLPLPTGDGRELYVLRPRDGFCSYLGRDGLCRVHKELGVEKKPAVCRMFPYRLTHTPDGWDAGLSLTCPTVGGGRGGDPRPEAQDKLDALPIFESLLREAPPSLAFGEGVHGDWAVYRAWETKAVRLLQDDDRDPAELWIEAIQELTRTVSDLTLEQPGAETTTELQAVSDTATEEAVDEEFVPELGLGDCPLAPVEAADVFAKDVALWSELLIGLEAADPESLRHLRSGATRLRVEIGARPEAAPVLAELARLLVREEETLSMSGEVTARIDAVAPDWGVQRRFLTQALMDKRLLDYGTVARGTALLTLLLAALRLPEAPGDEMRLMVGDAAYLAHHQQLADIVDSRAAVRTSAEDPSFHAALLGVRYAE